MSSQDIQVIKIGGNVIDNPEALAAFVKDFAALPGRKILVHGGGKEATRLSQQMGLETKMIDGRRVTDEDTLRLVTMVYAGSINKRIVAALQAAGCQAVGLSGADGNLICATRRPARPIDYGFVGDIDPQKVNDAFIGLLLDNGYTPVVCAIEHDGQGTLLNCNADSVASSVAIAASRLATTDLTFCFEKLGVLKDVDDPASLITSITPDSYKELRAEGVVSAGMIPKIDNAFHAIDQGVRSVTIKHSDNLSRPIGTTITA
ncbi:MAG: acetylglutamate kinase [Bacteroidales bacterium]|nr:acetylglutamate kinase [Bacteroidales bacterium]